jgi:hypothetical protein
MEGFYAGALLALEHSGLGHLARHSAWVFLIANLLHVLGAALLVGAIAVFDSALALRRYDDAARIGRIAIPVAAGGVALQVPSGLTLLAAEASKLGINPAFYAKMLFLAVGLANVAVFHRRFGGALRAGGLGKDARAFAFVSLAAWVLTLLAGRMIAYL